MISQDGLPGNPVIPGQHHIDFQPFWGTMSSSEYNNVVSCDSQLLLLQMNFVELQYSKFLLYKIT